jgi:hypothetical protein
MRGNPLPSFHRSAEAAGWPTLLIVSAACLALVVGPVVLLGVTEAAWVLVSAVLCELIAIAVLVGAVHAAMSDDGGPVEGERSSHDAGVGAAAPQEGGRVTALPRRERQSRRSARERTAA